MWVDEHRFWSQVDRRGPNQCWVWTGRRDKGGYGRYFDGHSDVAAHRVAFQLKNEWHSLGRLTHRCGNRACCNPRHLEVQAEMPWEDRFWSQVARRGPKQCWEWTGARNAGGYGVLHVKDPLQRQGNTRLAHRLAWELAHQGHPHEDVIHACGNRGCVNPAHLELGRQDNAWKLSEDDVWDIRERHGHGERQSRLAAEYRISRSMVSRIVHGTRWR